MPRKFRRQSKLLGFCADSFKNAQKSKWVPRELDQAINENKIVMPFDIDDCALQDDFNFYLTNVQRYNAYQNKSKAIEKCFQKSKQSWAFMII